VSGANQLTLGQWIGEADEIMRNYKYYVNKPHDGTSIKLEEGGSVTDTEAFKKWFGDSKVVDDKGNPLVMYHGTTADFDMFKVQDKSMFLRKQIGFHFGQLHQADFFTKDALGSTKDESSIVPVYLKIENPLRVVDLDTWHARKIAEYLNQHMGFNIKLEYADDLTDSELRKEVQNNIDAVMKALGERGIDGFVYRNQFEGDKVDDSYIVFNPTQIKSAIGNTTI